MLSISIDLGTYSIKFLHYKVERKIPQFIDSHEIIIDHELVDISDSTSLWANQLNAINKYLNNIEGDYYLFMNLPSDIVSMRYLELPVKSKKKASLMLPFQIEEDLPYSITDCHYSESFDIRDGHITAQVGLVRKDDFSDFFKHITLNKISPKSLTTDASIFTNYVKMNKELFPEQFCIIELGHISTKAYYFSHGELVSNHISYIGGKAITDRIGASYNISRDEATLYKHQNSFFLTEDQYTQVNENQRNFAKLMDGVFSPLLSEMKRWDIGHRVKYGVPVSEVYLIGGSSNIKNIDTYIENKLDVKVKNFDFFPSSTPDTILKDENLKKQLSLSSVLAQVSIKKSSLINFLKGEYSIQSNSEFPIESFAFVGARMAILTAIICISMLVENMFVSSDIKVAEKSLRLILKNQILELSGRDRRSLAKKPKNVLNKLSRKEKNIKQVIKTIQSSTVPNALMSLGQIVSVISGHKVELVQFSSRSQGDFNATFRSSDHKELERLDVSLRKNKSLSWKSTLSIATKSLTISGEERK